MLAGLSYVFGFCPGVPNFLNFGPIFRQVVSNGSIKWAHNKDDFLASSPVILGIPPFTIRATNLSWLPSSCSPQRGCMLTLEGDAGKFQARWLKRRLHSFRRYVSVVWLYFNEPKSTMGTKNHTWTADAIEKRTYRVGQVAAMAGVLTKSVCLRPDALNRGLIFPPSVAGWVTNTVVPWR
jgi:hypothetical protein